MAKLHEIVSYTNKLLAIDSFQDYGPNGLQVEGRAQVNTLVSGVTASQAFLDAAIEQGADAVLVHHGYFWKNEAPCVVGMKRRRLATLLENNISLLAYHLPLDAHPELGNNVQLARVLGFAPDKATADSSGMVMTGHLAAPLSGEALAAHVAARLGRQPLYVPGAADTINTIAWCTGGAQAYIEAAVELGVDAYLTGEVSEQTVHVARECGIHFIAAGHHATERYGAPALGEHLAQQFGIAHNFIDIDNPA